MSLSIITLIISIISIAFSAVALIMNRLSTFRRYRINHGIIRYYNVPDVVQGEAFIGVEVLNTGYHPITIVEFGFFDNENNRHCIPIVGVSGVQLPAKVLPGESYTLPMSIEELTRIGMKRESIKQIHVRDSLGKFKKQRFKGNEFSATF